MEDPNRGMYRSACAECQRRKQKCNREWPCNHCQKRKVADKCRFNNAPSPVETRPTPSVQKKRSRGLGDGESDLVSDNDDGDLDLEAIGYMAGPLLSSLSMDTKRHKKASETLDWVNVDTSPPLNKAFQILPVRNHMDVLVQIFFNTVNYHYYIIYPPRFLEEYQEWWERRSRQQPVTLQWTCLLVMICACATQHVELDMKPKIEADLGEVAEELAERYHEVSRELASAIPVGRYHLLNIKRMLHGIYWFKAEARFVEAWHLIGAAVRESQELGLHKDSESDGLPEFEREVRRRVWCILTTWDWQFASGLCRPTMIDHTDVEVQPPTLTLENVTPSPLLHMKLQSEAITLLAARFGAPKNVKSTAEVQEYKAMIEAWIRTFPAVYDTDHPDRSKDKTHPWVTSHRFYIHTMAYLMILNPIRTYMSKSFSKDSPPDELQVREVGISYSLRNLETTTQWTNYSSPRDGRYHFIIFSLFDTATVLCAAILKDEDGSVPRKEEIMAGVDNALGLLARINTLSKTAKTSYDILSRMVRRLPRSKKRPRLTAPPSRPAPTSASASDQGPVSGSRSLVATDEFAQVHGYSSASTSPSNFASSVTAGSSPQSNLGGGGEGYASSTPESQPSIDGRTTSSFSSSGTVPLDGSAGPAASIDGMIQPEVGGMVPSGVVPGQVPGGVPGVPPGTLPGAMAPPPIYADLQPSVPEMVPGFGYEPITDAELGEFNRLWDWQSLDLDFISSDTVASGNPP